MIIPGRSIFCFIFAALVFLYVWLSPRSKTLSKNQPTNPSMRKSIKLSQITGGIVLIFMGVYDILYPLD